jgi:GHMP kinase-like protein
VDFQARSAALLRALERVRRPRDLAELPPNDLASSPLADELRLLGAFRADVTGAGPAVYGLFLHRAPAVEAQKRLHSRGRTWLAAPAWYV